MKPEEYWARRMDQLNEAMLNRGEEYIRRQREEYERALAKIREKTERWYARLAKNNDISIAAARQLLDRNELKEFRWTVEEYIQRGRENAVDQRWVKELENASAKVHITRLRELEIHLQNEIEQLTARRLKGTTDTLGGIYHDSYYRSVFEIQKGTGVGTSFAQLDDRQIEKVLSRPWAPDGSNFSARIWKDRDKLVSELQTILTQDLIRGEQAEKVITDFAERFEVSRHAAERLIRTEAAYFAGQSRMDAYREMGVEQYKFVATFDRRTSEICRDMDGRVFRLSEARVGVNYPPLHVNCRSTTIPHFEDAEPGERAARRDDGATYYVPGDMTYREWAEQHAPTATEPASAPVPRPAEPPAVRQVPQEPRRFSNEQEATEWIDDVTPNWLTKLTPEEKSAVRTYSGIDYRRINQYLRSGSGGDAELDQLISNLSSALRKFDLQEQIVVYRGLDTNIFGVSDPQKLIGAVINEKAFISTSLLSDKAFDGPVRIEMHLPAGIYGAAIIPLSDYPEEYEFLLDRDLSYVILDVREEDGILILVVGVLLDGDQT